MAPRKSPRDSQCPHCKRFFTAGGLKQHMRFEEDARIGETLTATVTITHLRGDKALVNLDTLCTGEDGRMICAGDALVLFQC